MQSFGGPVGTTGATSQPPLDINGQSARFYVHEPTGEMVAVWPLGADEVALVAYLADFSQEQFTALAESVTLPDR